MSLKVRMLEGYDVNDGNVGGGGGGGGGNGGSSGSSSGQSGDDSQKEGSNGQDYDYDDNEIEGCGNQFRGNRCNINTNGYCIRVINPNLCRVSVYSDNQVTGGATLTNVALRNL